MLEHYLHYTTLHYIKKTFTDITLHCIILHKTYYVTYAVCILNCLGLRALLCLSFGLLFELLNMNSAPFPILGIIVTFAALYGTKLIRAKLDENIRSHIVQFETSAVSGKIETLPQGKSVRGHLWIPYAELRSEN